jgi:hypothetical protein
VVARPGLDVADIFRAHGVASRRANAGHISLGQLKAMSAIERCRTTALGGGVAALPVDRLFDATTRIGVLHHLPATMPSSRFLAASLRA